MTRALSWRARLAPWILLLGLVFGAMALKGMRPPWIKKFFLDGQPAMATLDWPESRRQAHPAGQAKVPRVRVVLIDGLGEARARALPELSGLCAQGLDLQMETGFPTVSLPVQHQLWTGLTQQQSGVQYRLEAMVPPPSEAIPGKVPGSVGVAESHPRIINSLGFETAMPPLAETLPDDWEARKFLERALEAVGGASPLVFVHILRVDEAGHAFGAASPEYVQAAQEADAMLAALVRQDPRARWFVLSDHGHLKGGGHGGAEPQIRRVRACLGGNIPELHRGQVGALHMVDLARAIAESVGVDLAPGAPGRALSVALKFPRPGETLPAPSALRWTLAAGILFAIGLLLWSVARGCDRIGAPGWLALAYVSVVLVLGPATLSNPSVYPPLGRDLLWAASPGALLLLYGCWRGRETLRRRPVAFVAIQLLPALGLWSAAMVLCGGFGALFGHGPPLMPVWTAHASVLTTLLMGAMAEVSLIVLVSIVHGRRR